jgi:hypothetical protein
MMKAHCILSRGFKPMTAVFIPITTRDLTLDEFLLWDDGSDRSFELLNGIPVPLSEPNANHEDVPMN